MAGDEADMKQAAGKPRKRPRSEQRRGPKAAATRDVLSEQVRRVTAPYAGAGASGHNQANYRDQFRKGTDDELYFRATRTIVVAARRWRKIANDRVKAVGQTMARWETLFLVAYSGQGQDLSQGELARLISVEGPTMVRMLDVLARDGLIERRQSDTDRRVTYNTITPQGKTVIRNIMAITNELRAEVLRDIDPEKLATTIETLSLILRRLDELR